MSDEPADKLTTKQRVFVEEYLTCWNASEAARRAGYAAPHNIQGPRLLSNVSIQTEIQRRLAEKAMSADEALARLAEHARGSMGDFLKINEEDGSAQLDLLQARDKLHLIKKYSIDDKGKVTIELYDAQSALALIGKRHGLFVDRMKGEIAITPSDAANMSDEEIEAELRKRGLL
jgi:phage terminase small subunit